MNIRRFIIVIILTMGVLSILSIPLYYVLCNIVFIARVGAEDGGGDMRYNNGLSDVFNKSYNVESSNNLVNQSHSVFGDANSVIGGLNNDVIIYFDADIEESLPWKVKIEKTKFHAIVGKVNLVYFEIENISSKDIIGYSIFDVSPNNAAQFFLKIQCFCFENQLLRAGEKVRFPLLFIVDDKILESNITDFTVYYHFSFVRIL